MTHYLQETDSKIIYPLPREVSYSLTDRSANETIGSDLFANLLPLTMGSNQLQKAWEIVYKLDNKDIARETRKLLSSLQENLSVFRQFQFDLSCIPPLHAFAANDGSVLLEWTFKDYRVGFNIEPEAEESNWFLVANRNLGEITASGYISGIDLNALILWLLNFVLSHS